MSAPANCPVILEANNVTSLALDLGKALRKFRRSKQRCQTCPALEECTAIQEIETVIRTTIQNLQEEWMDV